MARVVTVTLDDVAVAYPYHVLAQVGVIHDAPNGHELVVFYQPGTVSALDASVIADSQAVGATGVFDPVVDGRRLTFSPHEDGFVDAETGSVWTLTGAAITGPLAGQQLTRIVSADHFWFSWAAFRPATIIYTDPAEPTGSEASTAE